MEAFSSITWVGTAALAAASPLALFTALVALLVLAGTWALARDRREDHGHFTTGGIEDRIDSTLPPVRKPKMVPRS